MENDQAPGEGTVRYLKILVTILTATMILGLLTIVTVIVMRFNETGQVELPDAIALPDGTQATAFTRGDDWFAVVTSDDQILIYSRVTGKLSQRIQVKREDP